MLRGFTRLRKKDSGRALERLIGMLCGFKRGFTRLQKQFWQGFREAY